MATRHLPVRLQEATFARLDAESRRTRQSRSELAKTLLEEGLRMDAHPGIVFRGGPAGRRAGLAGGPDVWEIARVFRSVEGLREEAIERIAEQTFLTPQQVRIALRYFSEFQEEIDRWIQQVDEEAERAEAAWRREHELLAG